jgi:squalene synthase HpnC
MAVVEPRSGTVRYARRATGSSRAEGSPVLLPTSAEVLAKASLENFPVALRLLPRRRRQALVALYGWARLVDDVGDEGSGGGGAEERLRALDELTEAVRQAVADPSVPVHPLVADAAHAVREGWFDQQHLLDLAEANRIDQRVRRWSTFEELLGYCRWSANPVGRAVLEVFGVSSTERVRWSDQVTAGLQVVEHLQDVREDLLLRDRCYLPLEDLERFGVRLEDLRRPCADEAVRALVAYEASQARRLLRAARPLVSSLRGSAALAVAGFAAGGLAALDAISAAGFDVLAARCRPTKGRTVGLALGLLVGFDPLPRPRQEPLP